MNKYLLWITAVVALVATACGDGDGGGSTAAPSDPRGQQIVEMMQADDEFAVTEGEANCVANNMLTNLDDSTIDALLANAELDLDELGNPEEAVAALDAVFDCVSIEDLMVQSMIDDGTPEEAARCVADGFGEDELRTLMTADASPDAEADAFALIEKMFTLAADCGLG